jgi:hypothetical protein
VKIAFRPNFPAGFQDAYPGPYSFSYLDFVTDSMQSSLFLAGYGIPNAQKETTVSTGLVSADSQPTVIESPFIWNTATVNNAIYYGAAYYGRDEISVSFEAPLSTTGFSNLDNINFYYNNAKYKLVNGTVGYNSVQVNAEPSTSIADINTANGWTVGGTKTIANLDTVISGITLADWSTIPMVNA